MPDFIPGKTITLLSWAGNLSGKPHKIHLVVHYSILGWSGPASKKRKQGKSKMK